MGQVRVLVLVPYQRRQLWGPLGLVIVTVLET